VKLIRDVISSSRATLRLLLCSVDETVELSRPRHAVPARGDNNGFAECGVCRVVIYLADDALNVGKAQLGGVAFR